MPSESARARRRRTAPTEPFIKPLHDLALLDPLAALRALAALRDILDDAEALAMATARAGGISWRLVAPALGCNYRSAHRRYRYLDVASPTVEPGTAA